MTPTEVMFSRLGYILSPSLFLTGPLE